MPNTFASGFPGEPNLSVAVAAVSRLVPTLDCREDGVNGNKWGRKWMKGRNEFRGLIAIAAWIHPLLPPSNPPCRFQHLKIITTGTMDRVG